LIARSHDLVPGCLGSSPARSRANDFAGTFELYKDAGGGYRFYLKAPDGQIIASSESYKSKAAAQRGISAVRTVARGATVVDKAD
jgi:uncharacterized protein